jgi:hypothetical protein
VDSEAAQGVFDEESDRRRRFKRLAEARTNIVLDKIRILSHCANKYAYDYTDAEVDRIFETIESELRRAKQKFTGEQRVRFRLEEDV